MIYSLLLTQFLCSFAMSIVIITVQTLIYPQFLAVPLEVIPSYSLSHTQLMSWIVTPFMILELISLGLLWQHKPFRGWALSMATISLLGIWLSTIFFQVPVHNSLPTDPQTSSIQFLISSNWIRTILWPLKTYFILRIISKSLIFKDQ